MSHAELVSHVRQVVQRHLRRRTNSSPAELEESFLIHAGHYCGRRFVMGAAEAIWLFGQNQIQLLDAEHKIVETIPLDAGVLTAGRAA